MTVTITEPLTSTSTTGTVAGTAPATLGAPASFRAFTPGSTRLQVSLSRSNWTTPVSNDPATVGFAQHVGASEAVRTGSYGQTLTFTLSTTQPEVEPVGAAAQVAAAATLCAGGGP